MTNEIDPKGPQDMRNIILDEKISYLPHTGLILSGGGWGYIPIDFRNGKFPDMTAMRNQRQDMYTSANTHSTRNRINHETIEITIFGDSEPAKTVRFEGHEIVNTAIVYSLDAQHQYYYVYDYNPDKEKRIRKIVKYDGDRLIFSTDEVPINRIDSHYVNGKKFVVDSKGNIYYYSGDSGGIKILRWTLK